MNESSTDSAFDQSLADLSQHRVRLPGYFNALAAQVLHDDSPGEFDAEKVGTDQQGQGVYVVFWRPPQRGQA